MAKPSDNDSADDSAEKKTPHPFRRALLRGLGVVLPPLLTIVFFIWVWSVIENNVLSPLENAARQVIVWVLPEPLPKAPEGAAEVSKTAFGVTESFSIDGRAYQRLGTRDQFIPFDIKSEVDKSEHAESDFRAIDAPTASDYYWQYAKIKYLRRERTIPVFLLFFILALYLLGKFLAAGLGRFLYNLFEGLITRLPIIRNVYSSVKQVTDFVFSEREVEFNRVVAIEYPRKGIWSLGFVTGESMLDIRSAANEPVLTVLMPTSPMPATGFTVTVLRSEAIDVNLTVDQAIQFIVSCGVVIPTHQQYDSATIGNEFVSEVARLESAQETEGTGKPGNDAEKSS